MPFRVIGTMSKKGQSTWGQDQDDVVLIPLVTARQRVLGRNLANARAVSYTHLRAHETVLDIVCRLLLDKKHSCHTHTLC